MGSSLLVNSGLHQVVHKFGWFVRCVGVGGLFIRWGFHEMIPTTSIVDKDGVKLPLGYQYES